MGYPYGKKVWKTNEFFKSRDLVFHEHIFPFHNHISYVENFGIHREELSPTQRPGHAPHLLDYDSDHEAQLDLGSPEATLESSTNQSLGYTNEMGLVLPSIIEEELSLASKPATEELSPMLPTSEATPANETDTGPNLASAGQPHVGTYIDRT